MERKKRKWDVAAPAGAATTAPAPLPGHAGVSAGASKPGQPLGSDIIARAQAGAAAAMEKINKDLLARGLLPAGKAKALGLSMALGSEELPEFGQDVVINDAPAAVRYLLTKRTTQEEIQRRTRTGIVNKGRYHAPGAPPDEKEKPLFLRVVPGSDLPTEAARRAAVASAVADIHTLVRGERLQPREPSIYNAAPPPSYNAAPPPAHLAPAPMSARPYSAQPPGGPPAMSAHMVSLFMGFEAPPAFNLASRLQGPGSAYFDHIAKESSSTLQLRGQGSGQADSEPLHVLITAQSADKLSEAQSLAQNLIDTVKGDFQKEHPGAPVSSPAPRPGPPPQPAQPPAPSGWPQYQQPGSYEAPPHPGYGAMPPPQQAHTGMPPPYGQATASNGYPPPAAGSFGAAPSAANPAMPPAASGAAPAGQPPPSQYPPQGGQHPGYPQQPYPQAAYGQPPPGAYSQSPAPYGGPPAPAGYYPPPASGSAPYYPSPGGQPPPGPYGQPPPYGQQAGPPRPYGAYGSPAQPQGGYAGQQAGGGHQQQQQQPQQQQQQQQQPPPKRRFREFKEGGPSAPGPQVNPYQQQQTPQPQPQQQQPPPLGPELGPQQGPQQQPTGPPRPAAQGGMGPPPPRAPGGMGPPPPRAPRSNAGTVDVTGGMSLVDYGGED